MNVSKALLVAVVGLFGCSKGGGEVAAPENDGAAEEGGHGHAHDAEGEHGAHGEHTMHGSPMHHRFEDAEEWAKAFDDPARDEWQKPDAVIEKLALSPNAIVADIGAGTGYFSMRFAKAVPDGKVLASDIEPDMVRYLGERASKESLGNVVPVEGESSDPKLPEPVDVAFMCNTYHHVADRTKYFETVAGYLRKGGVVVIVDFKPDAPDDAPGPPKKHRVAPGQVAEELGAAGYELIETDAELLPYQYVAIFRGPAR